MGSIGNLSLKTTLDSSQFESGLVRSADVVKHWGARIKQQQKELSAVSSSGGNGLSLGGAAEGIQGAASSIPMIGASIAGVMSVAGFGMWMKSSINDIVTMGRESEKLGISIDKLSVLQVAAGPAAEAMDHGLMHLSRTMGEAMAGSTEVAEKIERMGLKLRDLANMTPDQQLVAFAEKITNMGTQAEKTAAEVAIFGKSGQELQGVLAKIAGGLAGIEEKARLQGNLISAGQLAEVQLAAAAIKDIELTVQGLGRQFAINLAPYIKLAADYILDFAKDLGGMDKVAEVFVDTLVDGIASMLDGFTEMLDDLAKMADALGDIANMGGGFEAFKKGFLHPIDAFFGSDDAPADEPGKPKRGDSIRKAGEESKARIAAARAAKPDGSSKADNFADAMQKRADELTKSLGKQADAFGLSGGKLDIFKLKMDGATDAQLKLANSAELQLKTLQDIASDPVMAGNIFDAYKIRAQELADAVKSGLIKTLEGVSNATKKLDEDLQKSKLAKVAELFQATRTPLEQLRSKLEEIAQNDLLKGNADLLRRAQGGLLEDFVKSNDVGEQRSPSAVYAGSAEAYSLTLRSQQAAQGGDPAQRLQAAVNQQLEVQKRQEELQKQLVEAAKNGPLKIAQF